MGIMSFPVVGPGQITDTWDPTTNARGELGTILLFKDSNGNTALVEIVQLDNAGCSQGEALITNYATLKSFSVAKASTTDGFAPGKFRGLAAATIASQKAGYMIIGGYCEKADLSLTAASADGLCLSGSVAGKLTPQKTAFWGATVGLSSTAGTAPFFVAVAKSAFATGIGSVQIIGVWG